MLSTPIQKLIQSLKQQEAPVEPDPSEEPVTVNELTSKAGRFYERIRYLFDYKEEHTIRRSAVERQLKRQLAVGSRDAIGQNLVQELISGGYLPNRSISEQTVIEIQRIADWYMALDLYPGSRIRKRLISLAATEIDQYLKPQILAELTVEALYETVVPKIQYSGSEPPTILKQQAYVACRLSLLEEDEDMLFYALWKQRIYHLQDIATNELARQVPDVFSDIQAQLHHSLGWQILPRLKNYKIYFLILKKVIERYGAETQTIFASPERLQPIAEEILKEEYQKQYTTARKSGVRAIAYIFFTKIIVALAFEFPAELYFYNEINYVALGSNIVIHPFLLFLMTRGLPKLRDENIQKVYSGVTQILTGEGLENVRIPNRQRSSFFDFILFILYLLLFLFTFGVIVSILSALEFNIVSILLFLAFLTLVSYFGFRIRHNAKKWRVTTKDKTLSLLWRIFTLPIVRAGRWLSRTFSTINVFVFMMDFIIETPFKLVLGLFDAFISFLREKEEEIY